MTISQPNPEVNPTGAEIDEFIDDPPQPDTPDPSSPTPHSGEPDRRPDDVVRRPSEDVQEGISSPNVGP